MNELEGQTSQAAIEERAVSQWESVVRGDLAPAAVMRTPEDWQLNVDGARLLLVPPIGEWYWYDPVHETWESTGYRVGEVDFAQHGLQVRGIRRTMPGGTPAALPQATSGKQCTSCGSALSASAKFCPGCGGAVPPPADRPCPNCGGTVRATGRFCPTCGHAVDTPMVAAAIPGCLSCGTALAPGGRFCRTCGAPVGVTAASPPPPAPAPQGYPFPQLWPARSASAQKSGFIWSPATIVAVLGLVAVVVSVYLPWAKFGTISISALDTGARFRLGDWQGRDNLDGYVVAGLGLVALLFTLLGSRRGAMAGFWRQLGTVASGFVIPIAIMEVQFVLSYKGVDLGYGLYVLIGGAILASVARMLRTAQ